MKKRNERRRRTRKAERSKAQKGGAQDSIQAWIDAVKSTDIFKNQLGEYTLGSLKDDRLKFEPKQESSDIILNIPTGYDINSFNSQYPSQDIRDVGNSLALIRNELFKNIADNTPTDFKNYIENRMQDLNDQDFQMSANYMVTVEQMLRNEDIKSLTDDSKYPLFVWALMINSEAKEIPTLVPEKQVTEELKSQGLTDSLVQPEPAAPES
jgi:hypothetical protein